MRVCLSSWFLCRSCDPVLLYEMLESLLWRPFDKNLCIGMSNQSTVVCRQYDPNMREKLSKRKLRVPMGSHLLAFLSDSSCSFCPNLRSWLRQHMRCSVCLSLLCLRCNKEMCYFLPQSLLQQPGKAQLWSMSNQLQCVHWCQCLHFLQINLFPAERCLCCQLHSYLLCQPK